MPESPICQIRFPEEFRERVRQAATREDMTFSAWVKRACERDLKRQGQSWEEDIAEMRARLRAP